jgi:hypothetical protein
MPFVVGVDVGKHGALAFLDVSPGARQAAYLYGMPLTTGERGKEEVCARTLRDLFVGEYGDRDVELVCVESVHSNPQDGVASSFSFGVSYGKVKSVLELLGLVTTFVTPQAWKKAVLAGTDHSKRAAVGWAQAYFPSVSLLPTPRCKKPDHNRAEALCIAEYGRRLLMKGDPS